MTGQLHVLVLGGGPDRERPVSLKSAAAVAAALREAGHRVSESDITPDDPGALDTDCEVVFPVLHGGWGEGGPLQRLLEGRGVAYVGARPQAAALAMDKLASKAAAQRADVPTPDFQMLRPGQAIELEPPLVLKPQREGSSFGVAICHRWEELEAARGRLAERFANLMVERYVAGREVTVGVVGGEALPPIEIVPAEGFYDFHAKYDSDQTAYRFEIDLPGALLEKLGDDARRIYEATGCRHLGRGDFLVDEDERPWFLELNTMPGFTDHSLLPMAAERAGMPMPALCDRLVRLAAGG